MNRRGIGSETDGTIKPEMASIDKLKWVSTNVE